jgi:hypothetical protein
MIIGKYQEHYEKASSRVLLLIYTRTKSGYRSRAVTFGLPVPMIFVATQFRQLRSWLPHLNFHGCLQQSGTDSVG